MDNRKTIPNFLFLCNQQASDFKNTHGTIYVLKNGIGRIDTLYVPDPITHKIPVDNIAPTQVYFYRAMSLTDAYLWLEWLHATDDMNFPLDRTNPLCLASCMSYSMDREHLKKGFVLIEFFAPGFASQIFDTNRQNNKIFGLKSEGTKDYSWGLSIKTQMSCNNTNKECQALIASLPILFKNAINRGGSFKVVAFYNI